MVGWLEKQNIKFNRLDLYGSKEIGTLLSYSDNNDSTPRCRPFNSMEFDGDIIIKRGINEQGKKIAVDEINWYKHVKELGFKNIPEIFEYEPLKMKRVQGKNIFEYDCLTKSQKREILRKLIEALKELHSLEPSQPVNIDDVDDNFLNKTFDRLSKVEKLVPFADKEFIKINGSYYKNVFFNKEELKAEIKKLYPTEFRLIHGDCTFSNLMFDTYDMKAVLIDPRGYFGKTKFYGDVDYDWAKLYYSLVGDYDQFNRKKFTLDIRERDVELAIKSNGWSDMEEFFFDCLPSVSKKKIKLLHAIIWLSLTTYAWEDYDSICGAYVIVYFQEYRRRNVNMFTVEIYRDGFDTTCLILSTIGAFLIPILIWFFGSFRAEKIKNQIEQRDLLNYLLNSAYRYFQYFNNLKGMANLKIDMMKVFLASPNELTKNGAYSMFAPPTIDFDIKPSNYAFTIAKNQLISDIIFHFLQVLSDVNSTIDYINEDMKKNFADSITVPMESFIRTAQGHIQNNIPSLIFKINMGQYMLIRLIEEVENYNKYLNKKYFLMPFYLPPETVDYIQQLRQEITAVVGNSNWEKSFMNFEMKTKKENWKTKLKNKFKNTAKK